MKRDFTNPFESEADVSRPYPYGIASINTLESHVWTADLQDAADVQLREGTVSEVRRMLRTQQADAVLLSPADLNDVRYPTTILPAGCVSTSGISRTLQVRSRVEPKDIRVIWADMEATMAIAVARIVWMDRYDRSLHIIPYDPQLQALPDDADAVIFSADRLMSLVPKNYNRKIDLGEAWTETTGLPLVHQLWVTLSRNPLRPLHNLLETARHNGLRRLSKIAQRYSEHHGWSPESARVHLEKIVSFEFEDAHIDSLEDFFQMASEVGVLENIEAIEYWSE